VTFEANGKQWETDDHTLDLMSEYRSKGDQYMVSVVFSLGREFGRIKEAKPANSWQAHLDGTY
jgi:hypothetical protein